MPPTGYVRALRRLADEHGVLLIADESMTGMGRTGTILASDQPDVRPDVVVLGKGLGNGYPVSAICAPTDLMQRGPFGAPSASSSRYGGFPLACRAVAVVAQTVHRQQLADRAGEAGTRTLTRLRQDLAGLALVSSVHGIGMAIGISLNVTRGWPSIIFHTKSTYPGFSRRVHLGRCCSAHPTSTFTHHDICERQPTFEWPSGPLGNSRMTSGSDLVMRLSDDPVSNCGPFVY